MPAVLHESMTRVLNAILKKAVRDTEESVNQIQNQVLALTTLSEFQKEKISGVTRDGEARLPSDVYTELIELMHSNSELAGVLMPIITSLQFQDRLRQELESLSSTVDAVFSEETTDAAGESEFEEFWRACARKFTNIESRKEVLKSALGETYQVREEDIRDSQDDDDFFL